MNRVLTKVSVEGGLLPYLGGDWHDFAAIHQLRLDDEMYSVDHDGDVSVEVISGIQLISPRESVSLLAGRFDHFLPSKTVSPVARIYEFSSYGMALIDQCTGTLEVRVCKPLDKVCVTAGSYCALYGMGEDVRTTQIDAKIDAKNSTAFSEWQEWLKKNGPPLMVYVTGKEVVFVLNRLHVNSVNHKFGARLTTNPDRLARTLRVSRLTRLDLAPFLYSQLTTNPDLIARFRSIGIRIQKASQEVILPEDPHRGNEFGTPTYFRGHLMGQLPGSLLRSYLGYSEEPACTPTIDNHDDVFLEELKDKLDRMAGRIKLRVSSLPTVVVIEGTGAWTESMYRKALHAINGSATEIKIKVIYINDEEWSKRPKWVDGPDWKEWESYYSKADFARLYQQPGLPFGGIAAVFVVTPDRTHAQVAQSWLGKTPVIFVEKPFETDVTKVQELLLSMAANEAETGSRTAVMGIDHYLLRIAPIIRNGSLFQEHLAGLDGEFCRVCFDMTESGLIEFEREKTLELGLGIDLLPHFAAVLLPLGPLATIDFIRVTDAVQYDRLEGVTKDHERKLLEQFENETGVVGSCRFKDFAGLDVEATFCVGKGVSPPRKQLRLFGKSGQCVTFDFDKNSSHILSQYGQSKFPVSEKAYQNLLEDLHSGGVDTLCACLSISDAEHIVRFLDPAWRGTQWIKAIDDGFRKVGQGTNISRYPEGGNQ